MREDNCFHALRDEECSVGLSIGREKKDVGLCITTNRSNAVFLASRPHQATAFLHTSAHTSVHGSPLPTPLPFSGDGMELATVASPLVTLPKRTRLNVRQSKDGCIICKARRVKCDETKPTCLRCHRAGRVCEGYVVRDRGRYRSPESSPTDNILTRPDSLTISRSSLASPVSSFCYSSQEAAHCRLGLEILLQQRREQIEWNEVPSWLCLIAQSLPASEAISRAVISLGASFEVHFQPSSLARREHASAQNRQAINALRKEIASPSQGLGPVFLACIILAAVEVLQRHLANALIHVQGAIQALKIADSSVYADLHFLAQSLDLQTASYQLSHPPRLGHSFDPSSGLQVSSGPAEVEASTISLLHSCYHFANRAGKFKYRSRGEQPPSLILEQSRYIAALTEWLAIFNESANRSIHKFSVLRAQCLSTLIYVSTILCPHEVTYDLYFAHFQLIVRIAEGILARTIQNSPFHHFKMQPDVFQALYLTAMKCRNPQLRRRAVQLFSQLGTEGPWNARVMSRVAQRAIEIEEMGRPNEPNRPIPELERLHGCGVDSLAPEGRTFPIFIQAHFSLCNNVEKMLQSSDHESPEHWTLWSEDLLVQSFHGVSVNGLCH